MTKDELEELITDCPTLFHMAERGSWNSINEKGLLSTTALLDLYQVKGQARRKIESERRSTSVALNTAGLPQAIVRDQIPMDDAGLRRCLPKHLTPSDWYELLNTKVFFWLTRDRLHRLTGAKAYRKKPHDVIEIDSKSLIQAHIDHIWLCPMNSGNTKPFPHPRDETTFSRVSDYPYKSWRSKRKRGERVVELAIDHSVPDLRKFVTRVVVVQGTEILQELYHKE